MQKGPPTKGIPSESWRTNHSRVNPKVAGQYSTNISHTVFIIQLIHLSRTFVLWFAKSVSAALQFKYSSLACSPLCHCEKAIRSNPMVPSLTEQKQPLTLWRRLLFFLFRRSTASSKMKSLKFSNIHTLCKIRRCKLHLGRTYRYHETSVPK